MSNANQRSAALKVGQQDRASPRRFVLPTWCEAKKRFFRVLPGIKTISALKVGPTAIERALAMSGLVGAIAAPTILGLVIATPAVVSGMFSMPDSVLNRDCLRLLASFCALNVVTCISGFTFMIGRHVNAANQLEEVKKRLASLAVTIDDLYGTLDAREGKPGHSGGRKKRDVPRTWSGLSKYLAINPRFLKEVGIRAAGSGDLRLVVDPNWVEMWVDRLRNPELNKLEFVLFIDRNNPIIAEATGRTLLRFAKLLDEILRHGGNVDKTKLRIYLTESAEVQRSFFIVKRKVAGRSQDMVLQYSRSIEEHGHGAITDVEAVEPITDEDEMAKFLSAAGIYLQVSRSSSVEALLAVFRDILRAEIFRSLSPKEWMERVDAIYQGVSIAQRQGYDMVVQESEFNIKDEDACLFVWEQRKKREKEGSSQSTRPKSRKSKP